jgi:hypothetical protein
MWQFLFKSSVDLSSFEVLKKTWHIMAPKKAMTSMKAKGLETPKGLES